MRLDKFLSHASPLSRNDAKKAIKAGRVRVNSFAASSANQALAETDQVTLDGQRLVLPGQRYFMLHKPKGYICATEDPDQPTVNDLVQESGKQQLHSAGRLDKDTTGLVLLTDDGHWSHRVTSPGKQIFKTYLVTLSEPLSTEAADSLQQGVELKGENHPTAPAKLEMLEPTLIRLSISEGRYHQVKRMLAAVGNHVVALHREAIGLIELDSGLEPGQYRPLTAAEIEQFS